MEQAEWSTPEFELVTLNCEISAYAPADYEDERI